jgi:hypothetical protein
MLVRIHLFGLALFLFAATMGSAAVINHLNVDGVASVPQGVMDFVGQQRWYFTHASVGWNMLNGMNSLHTSDPSRYKLVYATGLATPPSTTVAGTIYQNDRGNPGWLAKTNYFVDTVNGGWKSPKVQFAMDKYCYIDPDADVATYLSKMSSLEATNPATKIVYCTIPLTTSTDPHYGGNVERNDFNDAVRAHCASNDKLLLDIADIESHSPAGVESNFTYNGKTYQILYSGYTTDGGHPATDDGQRQIAKGWYAMCVYGTRFVTFNEIWSGASSNSWGTAANWAATGASPIVPDAPGITVTLGMPGANATVDLGSTGRTIGGMTLQSVVSTTLTGAATLTLDNNGKTTTLTTAGTHEIAAGLYFKDDLEIGGGGNLTLSGAFGGDAAKTFTVLSGTTVTLTGTANNIGNPIAVLGQLHATSLHVPALAIGGTFHAQAVPEPSSIVLVLIGAMGALACLRRK